MGGSLDCAYLRKGWGTLSGSIHDLEGGGYPRWQIGGGYPRWQIGGGYPRWYLGDLEGGGYPRCQIGDLEGGGYPRCQIDGCHGGGCVCHYPWSKNAGFGVGGKIGGESNTFTAPPWSVGSMI